MKKENPMNEQDRRERLGKALSDVDPAYIAEADAPVTEAAAVPARSRNRAKRSGEVAVVAAVLLLAVLFVFSIPVFNRMISGVPADSDPVLGPAGAVPVPGTGASADVQPDRGAPGEPVTTASLSSFYPSGEPYNVAPPFPGNNADQGGAEQMLPYTDPPVPETDVPEVVTDIFPPVPDTTGPADRPLSCPPHVYTEWGLEQGGGCTGDWVYVRGCTVCRIAERRVEPAPGHQFGSDGTCIRCGLRDMPITVPVDGPAKYPDTTAAPEPQKDPAYPVCNGFYYTVNNNADGVKTCTIRGCEKSAVRGGLLEIPVSLDGYPVAAIGENAFYGRDDIGTVMTSGAPLIVESGAFYACRALYNVCTDGMTEIREFAFSECRIPELLIYPSVTLIDTFAFADCDLWFLNFEEGGSAPLEIRSKAFAYLTELNFVHLPKRTSYIDSGAFAYDDRLLIVSCSAEKIRQAVGGPNECPAIFFDCPAALVFTDIENFIDQFRMLRYDTRTPSNLAGMGLTVTAVSPAFHGTEITVPDMIGPWTVGEIDEAAFGGSDTLTSVTLPDTIHTVGPRAFANCPALRTVTLPAGAAVSPDAFEGTTGVSVVLK